MTRPILVSMAAGVALGTALNAFLSPTDTATLVPYLHIMPQIFLRLIKCMVAPLVFTMLTVGIADHGHSKELGRIGLKAMGLFLGWSLLALTIGMIGADTMQPGVGSNLSPPPSTSAVQMEPFNVHKLMEEIIPQSGGEAWANNAVLQIVVLSILAGLALSICLVQSTKNAKLAHEEVQQGGADSFSDKARKKWRHARHELATLRLFLYMMKAGKSVTFRVVSFVMWLAPAAAFFSLTAVVATSGPGVLVTYGRFAAEFCLSLLVLWLCFYVIGTLVIGRQMPRLLRAVREPALLAFSTASSEAALPRLLEELDGLGVPPAISGLVLPLGYSFNLDGSMMYCSFAVLFIAQVYGQHLTIGQQIFMLLTLMVTSKGMAAVPKASLVIITGTLTQFNIPEAGVALILAVDQLLDMCRTATNVMGNTLTCVLVTAWEGHMKGGRLPQPEVLQLAPAPTLEGLHANGRD